MKKSKYSKISWGYLGEEPVVGELVAAAMEERGRRQGQEQAEPSGRSGFREEIADVVEAASRRRARVGAWGRRGSWGRGATAATASATSDVTHRSI